MIVHILLDEKFTNVTIDFVINNFDAKLHKFYVICHKELKYIEPKPNWKNVVYIRKSPLGLMRLIVGLIKANKIILHSLFSKVVLGLMRISGFNKKALWFIWGGDLYSYKSENKRIYSIKSKVVSRLKGIITPFQHDYDIACEKYGATCKWYDAMLPNCMVNGTENVYKIKNGEQDMKINILVGNSADPENNHFELLSKLKACAKENIKIYIPLSYGDKKYAKQVAKDFENVFYDKVMPIFDFMTFDEYRQLLHSIDVAIFAHNRQQAFGNIIQLLAGGAKVFIKKDTSIWSWAQSLNINIYDINELNADELNILSPSKIHNNLDILLQNNSLNNIVAQWSRFIFD